MRLARLTTWLGTIALCVFVLSQTTFAAEKKQDATIGRVISDFTLQDYRGKSYSLADYDDYEIVVVAFLGTECPLARLYGPRLQELADEFADRGVAFLGIDSNRQDSITELAHYARVHDVRFPLLKDVGNVVADQFGARRTPEVFVLDRQRKIRYRGRVDDQFGLGTTVGYAKTEIRRRHLVEAIEELLAGKPVSVPFTEAPGCIIGRVRPTNESGTVTYGNQISRILQKHCVECHRPGQIAPFALTNYEDVVGWAEMIEEVVRQQRMPPWHADPHYGTFSNDRSMSSEEKELIYQWVADGAPAGDLSQVPEPIEYPEGWQLTEPEEVYCIDDEPFTVPATGVVEYQYFIVDPGWKEDRWIRTSECLIDNRQVVHHVFVFAVPPEANIPSWDGPRPESDGISGGGNGSYLIGGAAPGTPPTAPSKPGMATFVKAGTRLLFQMHYTPIGRDVKDRTCVGFTFADPSEVTQNVRVNMAINLTFRIPPGASDYPVEAFRKFDRDTLIVTMAPHMHLRGKSFRYDLEYPDGSVETILNIPHYDFNWQNIYYLAKPKFAPAGTRLHCYATFDNSEDNLANPDPTAEVRWGEQTWEEMMIGWFMATTDIEPEDRPPGYSRKQHFLTTIEQKPPRISKLLVRAARAAHHSPLAMQRFSRRISKMMPQVDRVCISTVDDGQLRFLQVEQSPVLHYWLGRTERHFDADTAALAKLIASAEREPTVYPDLSQQTAPDLKTMASKMASSVHVPANVDGKTVLFSFWSRDADAFPPEAVELLQQIVEKAHPTQ